MGRWTEADCAVAGLAVVVASAAFAAAAALCSIAGGVFGVRFRRGLIFCLCAVLPSPPASAQDGSALRTTVFQEAEIAYEVIDGLAIYEGDIILGTAAEVAAWNTEWSPGSGEPPSMRGFAPRGKGPRKNNFLETAVVSQ